MENGRRAQLPRLFHDSTDEEMVVLREKYLMKGQSRLYEIRKENRNAPESSTPFIAVSLCLWPTRCTDANSTSVFVGQ
jgi:hypothetical protein